MSVHRATLLLYSLTIFLSAALLFLVQLIFARLVLPLLGGAPAVWNTAMVFYQAVLLAGYGYAHWLSSRFRVRTQVIIHALVLLVPLAFLPLAVPAGWQPPAETTPIPWLLGLLAVAVGVPFFAVSTTSPLLQKWFAATPHPAARDPYFLYAASNAGSLIGLFGYPFLIEPASTLRQQTAGWTAGFGALLLLGLGCGILAWRTAGRAPLPAATPAPAPLTAVRRARWVLLALVPSSLMLSVTNYISSDIAAVPLLWVVPLGLYLLTFILVFARRVLVPQPLARRAAPLVLVPVVMALATGSTTPMSLLMGLHLLGFFVLSLVCHGEIALDRPPPGQLTEFYLWMSLGGVLGGVFNALLAPALFNGVYEYPLMLALAAFLVVPGRGPADTGRERWLDWALPAGLGILVLLLVRIVGVPEEATDPVRTFVVFGLPAVLCFLLSRHRLRFALGLGAVLLASQLVPGGGSLLLAERSFFGVHRVTRDSDGKFHRLVHGKTIHGMQSLDPARRREPLTYYHPTGPLGQVFAAWGEKLNGPIAGVGLGAGAAAVYGKPGQEFTFFEIDPVVKRVASDPRYFSYLSDSAARVSVVLGDARLKLATRPDGHFQLMILDAYSSDSIPVHLITREALQLYLRKLAPGGVIAFHISNLHMDLRPVVANLAQDAGLVCQYQEDSELSDAEVAAGKTPSQWAVLARSEADLAPLAAGARWHPSPPDPTYRLWTDDYSSLVNVLNFGLK